MIIPNYGGGYSGKYTNEIDAGFHETDHAALGFIIDTLNKRLINHN